MTDRFTVRTVVLGLLLIIVLSVVAALILALHGDDLPDYLKYVGTTALGVFGGILAKTSTDVQPVAVVEQPAAPTKSRRDRGAVTLGDLLTVALLVLAVLASVVLARHV